jgi:predicted CXXCH cytochrome family protein
MKLYNLLLLTLTVIFLVANGICQEPEEEVFEYAEENQGCLKCHGQKTYTYYNDWVERDVRQRMNPYHIVDSALFYQSFHRTFRCTDCHSTDYEIFPHPGELRFEEYYTCLDCHGGDEYWADYQFELIEERFMMSVHAESYGEEFSCWSCHNPHTYRVNARNTDNILEMIQYNNDICLSCHDDYDNYQLITTLANPNILETHKWLPNQASHYSKVRCIECHAALEQDVLVAHNIQPKEKAVKKCVECHSKNSLLMGSLFKHQAEVSRGRLGFFNSAILNDYYIIGANRNYYLNVISLILFGGVLAGIAIHATLRFKKK